ncbi:MAG: lytic transglycosylase domain-containing protein [Flavobacteriales bacterium]
MGEGKEKNCMECCLNIVICLFVFTNVYAQRLTATDQSEKSVRHYKNIIKQNKELVKYIEYSLSSRGVPKHLRNLAIIESHLDDDAVSHAGASGVWQLMPAHANQYKITADERKDMYKSTKVAVNSLINLYNKYHNWITVVAAYNCGEGNIQKAMNRAGSKKYTSFASFLPSETQNHVKKYLNASYATGELDEVLQDYYKTVSVQKTVTQQTSSKEGVSPRFDFKKNSGTDINCSEVNAAYNIEIIAKYLNINKEDILKKNPDIERDFIEKGYSSLCLNEDLKVVFEVNKNKIISESIK